ncbi:MAG: SIS domain-containing protein [SAR324 cluster bacterium]|nr:SIS domain-containing protein [SAR324 cluster bacterium]
MLEFYKAYVQRLEGTLKNFDWEPVHQLAMTLREAWKTQHHVYLCGNGGSAGNAIHLANDYIYGIAKNTGLGLRVEALPANPAILTCLANDISYEEIYSQQLRVKAQADDVLIVLSGSGNSPNILKALEVGNSMGMKTFAILGYSGGKALKLAQIPIHFPIADMQISEDLQMVVGHMCMQWLFANPV